MYGCSGQHHSRAFSWLSRVAAFAQRGEPIPPISVGRVAMNQSHTRVVRVEFIGTHLSFREAKPRKQEYRWLNTQGSEAVLKVQLQRRAGRNRVGLNQLSRVQLMVVQLHNTGGFPFGNWLLQKNELSPLRRQNYYLSSVKTLFAVCAKKQRDKGSLREIPGLCKLSWPISTRDPCHIRYLTAWCGGWLTPSEGEWSMSPHNVFYNCGISPRCQTRICDMWCDKDWENHQVTHLILCFGPRGGHDLQNEGLEALVSDRPQVKMLNVVLYHCWMVTSQT